MTVDRDVFDLSPTEQAAFVDAAEKIASEASELPDEIDPEKLPFLSWLWIHHIPEDEFYPLAHLVLSGGPGDVWARKTFLLPSFVARDIAEFFAVGRPGVTEEHLDLARKAITAWRASTETIPELIAKKRVRPLGRNGAVPAQAANVEVKNAQLEGFRDLGTVPVSKNANNPIASIYEVVPDVTDEQMPVDFRTVKVKCVHGVVPGERIDRKAKLCGRPSVPGAMLCVEHGGIPLAYSQEELKEIYNGARQRLIAATLMAVDATIDLARNSTNDMVRLKAAEVILDRTGFVPGVEIHLPGATRDGQIDKTPAQIVLERLNQLGIATPSLTPVNSSDSVDESDVVEAEVVGE
jgi:hypothetical protein